MKKIIAGGVLLLFCIVLSNPLSAGIGSGTEDSPNPTGGFGSTSTSTTTSTGANSTGGFGDNYGPDPMPLGPPPPPDEVPLDGGSAALIAAGIGLGIKKIFGERRTK